MGARGEHVQELTNHKNERYATRRLMRETRIWKGGGELMDAKTKYSSVSVCVYVLACGFESCISSMNNSHWLHKCTPVHVDWIDKVYHQPLCSTKN